MLMASTAFADVLPEGTKVVPICAYFNNTASVLDTMAVYGYETAPGGAKVDFSSFIANECFTTSYKFNSYKVYGVTAAHALTISNFDTYNPSTDQEAYLTNIELEIGERIVDDASTIERIENEYHIISLDTEAGRLMIEPVRTKIYMTGVTEPEITEGSITIPGYDTEEPAEDVFNDVTSTNKYYDALKYLKDNGIVGGYEDGSFKPENTINRAEFTKIVVGSIITSPDELTNCEAHYASQSSYMLTLFTDVEFAMVGGNIPPWYFDYVCVAKLNGIISGYDDGSFKPDDKINFAEASKIVTEAMGYQMLTDTTPWYMGYIKELANRNAIPTSITSFGQYITRGEMAEIMYRLKAEVTNLDSKTYEELK